MSISKSSWSVQRDFQCMVIRQISFFTCKSFGRATHTLIQKSLCNWKTLAPRTPPLPIEMQLSVLIKISQYLEKERNVELNKNKRVLSFRCCRCPLNFVENSYYTISCYSEVTNTRRKNYRNLNFPS